MEADPVIMPIEIRPDYFVQIMGIPHDLTAEEARKIAGVILAMAPGEYVIAIRDRLQQVAKLEAALTKIEGMDSRIDATIQSDGRKRRIAQGPFALIATAALRGD